MKIIAKALIIAVVTMCAYIYAQQTPSFSPKESSNWSKSECAKAYDTAATAGFDLLFDLTGTADDKTIQALSMQISYLHEVNVWVYNSFPVGAEAKFCTPQKKHEVEAITSGFKLALDTIESDADEDKMSQANDSINESAKLAKKWLDSSKDSSKKDSEK